MSQEGDHTTRESLPRRLPDDVLMQELSDGESVLVDLRSERFYGLDRVGTTVLKAALRLGSVQRVIEEVQDAFDAPIEVVRRDLLDLLASLEHRGLLVPATQATDPQPPPA